MRKNAARSADPADPLNVVRQLLSSQQVAVLHTHNQGQPYGTTVGFSISPDLKFIFFATSVQRANLPTSWPMTAQP